MDHARSCRAVLAGRVAICYTNSMSKFTNELKDLSIHNESGFYETGRVYIVYSPSTTGRLSRSARWIVCRPGYKTDPDAHFMDNGNKVFSVWGASGMSLKELRAQKLKEAQQWVEEMYGPVTEWKKDPFGGWSDASYVKARTKALKAALKALPFRTGDQVRVEGQDEVRIVSGFNGDGNIMLEGDPRGINMIAYTVAQLTKA